LSLLACDAVSLRWFFPTFRKVVIPSSSRVKRQKKKLSVPRFQTSAAKWMRTALFYVVTQRVMVNSCRRFGTKYSLRDNPEAPSSKTFGSFTMSDTTNPEIELRVTGFSTLEQYRCDNLKSSRHSLLRLLYGWQPFVLMKSKPCVMV